MAIGSSSLVPGYGTIPSPTLDPVQTSKPFSRTVGLVVVGVMVGAMVLSFSSLHSSLVNSEIEDVIDLEAVFTDEMLLESLRPSGIRGSAISIGPVEFRFLTIANKLSIKNSKLSCTQILWNREDSSQTHTLDDDFLCTSSNLDLTWSTEGPLDGFRCVNVILDQWGKAYDGWDQQYLCMPRTSPYDIRFSEIPDADENCLEMRDRGDHDFPSGYFCIRWAGAFLMGSQDVKGSILTHAQGSYTARTCNDLCVAYLGCDYWVLSVDGRDADQCTLKTGDFHEQHLLSASRDGRMTGIPFRCGDGLLNVATARCDDGNTVNGDGCDDICQPEDGYYCDPVLGVKTRCFKIAECHGPYADSCVAKISEPSRTIDNFARILPGDLTGVRHIMTLSSCLNCCDLAFSECDTNLNARPVAHCPIPLDQKESHKGCQEECKSVTPRGCDAEAQASPWWKSVPLVDRKVAGSATLILSNDDNRIIYH